jgi:signal transduction histidine kinase
MTLDLSTSIVVAIALVVFGLLLVLSASRLRSKELVTYHLTLYVGLGFFLSLTRLMDLLQVVIIANIEHNLVVQFALLAMILTFGALTLSFLRRSRERLISYWVAALVILLLWSLLAFDIFGWGSALSGFLGESNSIRAPLLVAGLGWILAIATALITVTADFRKRQTTQYLNRLRYWLIGTTLLIASGLVSFISPGVFNWAGITLLVAGSMVASYIVLSYHTPDLKLLVGRAAHYIGVTAILSTLLISVLIAAVIVSRNVPNPRSLLFFIVILAVFLAVVFIPLWRLGSRILSRIIFGKPYHDEKQVIQHYSRRISSALDMKRLGDTIINLMIETLGITQGIVLVNDRKDTGEILLRPLSSVGVIELTPGHFKVDSPFVDHFRAGNKTLSQYDVDVLPVFRSMPAEEKNWLSSLGMELYVAILRQHEMVGLLGFGRQSQGTAYYEEDLELMIALADQAAVAMDSARLFEQLAFINQEVGVLNEQLAGLDQNKSDFLSIASHELRTPLTHIHGYSRMLIDLTEEELKDPAYVKTLIEGIVKGSDRMKDVVDMMFDVTEADIGEMNLFLGPVSLEEVIEQAVRPFLPALDQRRIAFKPVLKDVPAIEADGTRLVQAFENLISNAVKYTPDGGMISVEGQAVIIDDVGGAAVEIVVSDTGIGIDPEHQSRIFEKFFRVDDTEHHSTGRTKFKGAGPGLGLTLVKAIAEAHGGRVWVESPGHDEELLPGSKFYFVIPQQQTRDADMPVAAQKNQKQSQIETRHWRRKDLNPTT